MFYAFFPFLRFYAQMLEDLHKFTQICNEIFQKIGKSVNRLTFGDPKCKSGKGVINRYHNFFFFIVYCFVHLQMIANCMSTCHVFGTKRAVLNLSDYFLWMGHGINRVNWSCCPDLIPNHAKCHFVTFFNEKCCRHARRGLLENVSKISLSLTISQHGD